MGIADSAEIDCREPGPSAADSVRAGVDIVALPEAAAVDHVASRPGEALLALPKLADGSVPTEFELAPGAEIRGSFFSPVLCSTIARVVGEEARTPEQLVIELPDGAAVLPHSVYALAAQELVPIDAVAAAAAAGAQAAVTANERESAATSSEGTGSEPEGRPEWRADPYRQFQYGLTTVEIERAWTVSDGVGKTVAILDSPPDGSHFDLPTIAVAGGEAASTREAGVHGTLMAGVIAAPAGNGVGISGVAPGAQLLSVPVCGIEGSEDCGLYDILRGIDVAWEHSADIVNLSLVGPSNPLLERAVARLERLGILVVAAAGNEGTREPRYPAAYPSVIGVGAVDRDGQVFERGNRGLSVEVMAPGVSVLSTVPGNSFAFASGTSLAAAHVSGSLALLLGADPEPERVREALVRSGTRPEQAAPVAGSLCDALSLLDRSCP